MSMIMTADQVKAKFDREGLTLAGWARDRGLDPVDVYKVLNGQHKGRRGKAHNIAVALGLKPNPQPNA